MLNESYINRYHRAVITPSGFVFVNPVCEQGSVPDAVLIGMAECQVMDGWLGAETRCVYFWVDSHLPVPRAIPSAVFPHMCVPPIVSCVLALLLSAVFVDTGKHSMHTP